MMLKHFRYITAILLMLAALSTPLVAFAEDSALGEEVQTSAAEPDPSYEEPEPEPSVEEPAPSYEEPEPEPSVSEPEPEPSYEEPEPSVSEPEPEPSVSEPEPEPSYEEPESSVSEPEPEPSYEEPEPEPSYEEESSVYEPEPEPSYYEEPSVEESSIVEAEDPFGALGKLSILLPADKPEDKKKEESSKSESSAADKEESRFLTNPPVPSVEGQQPPQNPLQDVGSVSVENTDNNSVLLGVIFWSVIGIVITAVLIIMLNFKGDDSEFVFSRKRYHKGQQQRSGGFAGKYR